MFLYIFAVGNSSAQQFNKLFMQIRVLVYINQTAFLNANARPVMERVLDWDNSLKFPFENILSANKALYGSKSVTVFELS